MAKNTVVVLAGASPSPALPSPYSPGAVSPVSPPAPQGSPLFRPLVGYYPARDPVMQTEYPPEYPDRGKKGDLGNLVIPGLEVKPLTSPGLPYKLTSPAKR